MPHKLLPGMGGAPRSPPTAFPGCEQSPVVRSDPLPEPLTDHKSRTPFKSPLAALAISFALGIVWAHSFRATLGIHWFLAGAAACILIGLILLRGGWGRTAVGLALASLLLAGVADARRWEQRFPLNHVRYLESMGVSLNDPVRLEGRVISTPYRAGYGMQFDVEAQRIEYLKRVYPVSGKVRLRVQGWEGGDGTEGGGPLAIHFHDEIRTLVRLRRPHTYQNPGSFDFRRWMEDIEDIYWTGTIRSPRLVERIGHTAGFSLAEFVERVRQRLLRGIDDLYPPWSAQGRYGAVLKAVLWGDRTSLDSVTIEDFRKTGLYHLLVIAGLHVGLITLLVEFLLRGLGCRRVTRSLIVLGFLVVYALLVEQRAPTLRATMMISLYLLARILDRGHSPLNAIGGVALILLYARPAWLFESGFQLSFAAALLIVGVAVPILERTTEPYRRTLRRLDDVLLDDHFSPRLAQARLDLRGLMHGLRRRAAIFERFPALARHVITAPLRLLVWVANILLFSAVLQLGLLLPMVETFHRVTLAGVGLNALAIPIMTLLLALALPINLLSVASPAAAAWPAKILSMVMALLFEMTHLPGLAPWLSYRMPAPPPRVVWGFCGAFVLAGVALRYAPRAVGAALAACALFIVLVATHPFAPRLPRGALRMTALDCGQGDAVFLVLPDGTTMLVDTGGGRARAPREGGFQSQRWDSGEDIVSPYLWSLGLKKIDVVALTRADQDHLGGFSAILANFRVGEVWHAPEPETSEYAALLENLAERGIPTRRLLAGDALTFGKASVRVVWPLADSPSQAGSREASSLVIRISAGGTSFLLEGDAGRDAEEGILASRGPLESQALKSGHLGSKSSPSVDFLARIVPRVAIVSLEDGAGGGAGLANSNALMSLQNAGARIFNTATDGATTVEGTEGGLEVRTYSGTKTVVMPGEGNAKLPDWR